MGRQDIRYWMAEDLTREAFSLVSRIAAEQPVAGIAGVPRSGMLAAAAGALHLGVPLYEASTNGIRRLAHGRRLDERTFQGRLVVLEDSLNTGTRFAELKQALGDKPIYASVFSTEQASHLVDYIGVPLEMPHWFDWWFWSSRAGTFWKVGTDFDGILCPDCPLDKDDDGARYVNWMKTVLPTRYAAPWGVQAIITGRLEKYRGVTQEWLRQHRMLAERLICGPWTNQYERTGGIPAFKAHHVKQQKLSAFIESNPHQAAEIAHTARVPVPCPIARKVFMPN
jgi:hypothetical protein